MEMQNIKERLIFELNSCVIIEGDLEVINSETVSLSNIVNCKTNNKTKDTLVFDRDDVMFAARLLTNSSSETNNAIGISNKLFVQYREMVFNYKLLTHLNDDYYEAIDDLLESESIGVVGLGNNIDRTGRISLIIFSTIKQIYIFDVLRNRSVQFFDNIRTILESEDIVKVVHGPVLNDYLQHQLKFKLNNVFDTQVADFMITKEHRSLSQCLVNHFNFPLSLLKESEEHLYSTMWLKRPLCDKDFIVASYYVVYLRKLKDHLKSLLLKHMYN